ncbi:methyl-CpG-binding domain-containing protein 6-like isoform X2 [Hibiscus syriacus]|uniref:methyl-CpG-binding domain-containing protein 6-like isoform X2 n=1 Tax=Hibiscus syriacus TaxID=106335 RepID=UPI0019235F89|nr:methyl-CpG-binding domain-containing protein 6-like isoform X2 [Hibiscus syriacus]
MSTPVQPSTTDLPSDPLLRPGAFIDANAQNQSAESSETPPNGSTPNGAQSETPVQGLDISPSSAESKGKRRLVPTETWLPTGWLIEDRVRSSGATAGLVDKGRGNSGGKKQKKPDKKSKPLNFDFVNMPQKVDWLLTNASEDFWIPFFGDGQVAEPTRQDWDAAFVFVTSRKTGQATH